VLFITLGIKLERTDIVGIEGNDEGCRPPQPTIGSLGSVVRYLSGVRGEAPTENEFGSF